jgi:hypothetical protein
VVATTGVRRGKKRIKGGEMAVLERDRASKEVLIP